MQENKQMLDQIFWGNSLRGLTEPYSVRRFERLPSSGAIVPCRLYCNKCLHWCPSKTIWTIKQHPNSFVDTVRANNFLPTLRLSKRAWQGNYDLHFGYMRNVGGSVCYACDARPCRRSTWIAALPIWQLPLPRNNIFLESQQGRRCNQEKNIQFIPPSQTWWLICNSVISGLQDYFTLRTSPIMKPQMGLYHRLFRPVKAMSHASSFPKAHIIFQVLFPTDYVVIEDPLSKIVWLHAFGEPKVGPSIT